MNDPFRSKYSLKSIVFIFLFLLSCQPGKKASDIDTDAHDVARIQSGLVQGHLNSSGDVRIFLGVPYAAPPVGDLRWKVPQPAASWDDVLECDHYGPVAMQGDPRLHAGYSPEFLIDPKARRSEDCLYLNLWTPTENTGDKRPVLVWIHGGGFFGGSSSIPVYDGESMAKNGIVFVNFNYRLGIFGFFAHPALTAESDHHTSGNYALLDQIAALRWVKDNIAAFGGDPDNITIDGQSVGSMCISYLMASPLTKGLFQHAIAESGPGVRKGSSSGVADLKEVERKGVEFAASVHANSLAELRDLSDTVLMKGFRNFLNPVLDGYVLPEPVYDVFREGGQNDVPLILGWNEGDGYIEEPLKSPEEFKDQLQERYAEKAGELLKIYPAANAEEAASSQLALSRDAGFGAGTFSWATLHAEASSSRVFMYYFTRKTPPASPGQAKFGAFHAANVIYELGNLNRADRAWQPEDRKLSGLMNTCWMNFITTGDPNGKNIPEWPSFDPKEGRVMIFGDKATSSVLPDISGIKLILNNAK